MADHSSSAGGQTNTDAPSVSVDASILLPDAARANLLPQSTSVAHTDEGIPQSLGLPISNLHYGALDPIKAAGDISAPIGNLPVVVTLAAESPTNVSGGGSASFAVTAAENNNAATTVTASDADAGATLTYSIVDGADATQFTIDPVTGVLALVTAPDYKNPTDTGGDNVYGVVVQVSDGAHATSQAIAVTVSNTNDNAPLITSSAAVTAAENNNAATTVTASDADAGATLTYSIVGGADATQFTIDPVTGVLALVTAPDYKNPTDTGGDNVYGVVVQVSDGAHATSQAIAVTVSNTNDNAPLITSSAAVTAAENNNAATTVTASDADAGATLTYSIVGGADATQFTIDPVTGVLAFVTAPDYENPTDAGGDNVYGVVVQVSDGAHATSQAIAVTVSNTNDNAPLITSSAAVTAAENSNAVTTVTASDADAGATLNYSIVGGADAAQFTIDPVTGALAFVTARDYENPTDAGGDNVYGVVVQVSDGAHATSQAIAVTVSNTNDNAPLITSSAAVTAAENNNAVTTVTASDADAGATLTYSIVGGVDATQFTIDPVTGVLAFVTAPDYENPTDAGGDNVYGVVVQVSDGAHATSQAIAVTVSNTNDNAPLITSSAAVTAAENSNAVTTVTASDADAGATLTYSIVGGADAAQFTIDPVTGALAFATAPDYENPTDAGGDNVYDVVVQVSDGAHATSQAIAVTVSNTNDNAPLITSSAAVTAAENSNAVTTVTASDADAGATLNYSIVGGADAAQFTIDPVTGALAFVTARDYENPTDAGGDNVYGVVVQVSDGAHATSQAIAVTVSNTNDNAPLITSSAAVTAAENSNAVTTVTASDADAGATLNYSIVGGADAAQFTIDPVTGALAFVTARDYENPTDAGGDNVYGVVVQVSDGAHATSQAIAVTVSNTNDNAPLITSSAAVTAAENSNAVTTVTASDADAGAT